ncbi:MAG: SRPBCC family protein [Betaproteobacteria bacterium]|nr:SRPBCC family protein [Betaproteobacteria bacterium]
MNGLAYWMAGLSLAASSLSAFADALELTIFHTITIDAPAEQVWAMAGDFGGIQRWAPGTESSRLILHERNETGAIRVLRRRSDGTQVTEKLLDYDPDNRRMAYTYVDGVVRASDYYSELMSRMPVTAVRSSSGAGASSGSLTGPSSLPKDRTTRRRWIF